MKKIKAKFREMVGNEFERKRMQLIFLLFSLGLVSGFMTIVNIVTQEKALGLATASFCLLSCLFGVIGILDKKGSTWTTVFFTIEIFALFIDFIITGGTEGFSTIWVLMLPTCGLFAFGRKMGSMLSGALLLILLFFFYLPFGRSLLICTSYTEAFLLRFPFLYLAFFLVGFLLEVVREETYDQLRASQEKSAYLSTHDTLTGLLNRQGLEEECARMLFPATSHVYWMMDLDRFKSVNDQFGHLKGDDVLCAFASFLKKATSGHEAIICRWGGEEFVVILPHDSRETGRALAEEVRLGAEHETFGLPTQTFLTVSIGLAASDEAPGDLKELSRLADQRLYLAKERGRNALCAGDEEA